MILRLIMSALLISNVALADDDDDFLPFDLGDTHAIGNVLPVSSTSGTKRPHKRYAEKQIIPFISQSIAEAGLTNLTGAEQVFCYHVTKRPKDYAGYTLDGFAIEDYCGELDFSKIATTYEALFTMSPNIITSTADCRIEPKVMLRFVRGVESTDVLLSSPCPSFTVFYGGKFKSFNIKQGIIDNIIDMFQEKEKFNSPALIKHTVANAKASTTEEADLIEKKNRELSPQMNWKKKEVEPQPEDIPLFDRINKDKENANKKTGWGKLKFNIKN